MGDEFVAFGLALRAAFPLPGLVPASAPRALPVLALELAGAGELEADWSGSPGDAAWRGRLGDGEELAVRRGRGGDILFSYGERARFLLAPGAGRLRCCPLEGEEAAWQRVLLTRVLPNVAIAAGYEALHASAVEIDGGVVAIAAASGGGKSTLALELVRRRARLFADDTLILGRGEAHPAGPLMNLSPQPPRGGGEDLVAVSELARLAGERWVSLKAAASRPAPVLAVVLMERAAGSPLAAGPLTPSPLVLAPFMLGLPDDEGREAARFRLYSDLVGQARLLRLSAAPDDSPAALAATLEAALDLGGAALREGAA